MYYSEYNYAHIQMKLPRILLMIESAGKSNSKFLWIQEVQTTRGYLNKETCVLLVVESYLLFGSNNLTVSIPDDITRIVVSQTEIFTIPSYR